MEKCFFLVWVYGKSGGEPILKIIRMKQCGLSLDHVCIYTRKHEICNQK